MQEKNIKIFKILFKKTRTKASILMSFVLYASINWHFHEIDFVLFFIDYFITRFTKDDMHGKNRYFKISLIFYGQNTISDVICWLKFKLSFSRRCKNSLTFWWSKFDILQCIRQSAQYHANYGQAKSFNDEPIFAHSRTKVKLFFVGFQE